MQIVLNKSYGGFAVPEEIEELGLSVDTEGIRTNSHLIEWVIANPNEKFRCACLKVAEIPEDATDYEISEYDGWESLIYVRDGKIHHA